MTTSDFHNCYQYELSSDDAECMQFLLSDYLHSLTISSRRIQDFVFLLLRDGYSENETLNILVEALFYVPRLDILYECSISYNEYQEYQFGKLIKHERLLCFMLFNEFEEKEFMNILNILLQIHQVPYKMEDSILTKLNFIKDLMVDANKKSELIGYFKNHGNRKTKMIVQNYEKWLESYIDDKEELWHKVSRSETKDKAENLIVALEKGDDVSEPKFASDVHGRVKIESYDSNGSYDYPEMVETKSVCLIFEINDYSTKPRKGSEIDSQLIVDTFDKLHFKTHLFTNVTKTEMLSIAQQFASVDVSKSGAMLVCFLLAHGDKDCILDINEEKVNIRQFSLAFSAKNSRAYKNKPKLFFIQACQGDRYHEGIPESSADTASSSQISYLETDSKRSKHKIKEYKKSDMIPEEVDFIYGMATVTDYVAFRSTKDGSWYITELCNAIEHDANRIDVLTLLTGVIYKVSQMKYHNSCQLPTVHYTARKKCYLTQQIK